MSDLIYNTRDFIVSWLPRVSSTKEVERVIIKEVESMFRPAGQTFVRIAGLSGLLAVALGAYGAHAFRDGDADAKLKHVFDTGNRYHFLHTLALMAIPMARKPHLTGVMMVGGMVMFSGSCYFHALTGSDVIRRVTPYGGMLLMAAWGSMIL